MKTTINEAACDVDDELDCEIELFDSLDNPDNIPNIELYDERMRERIEKQFESTRKYKKRKLMTKAAGTVVAAVIMIAVITSLTGRTDALFAQMMSLLFNEEDTYTQISANNDNISIYEFEGYYYPHYKPEGYELTYCKNMKSMGSLIFERKTDDKDYIICFSFCDFNATNTIDSEDSTKQNILINDRQGIIYSKNDGSYNILVFQNEDYVFTVDGNTSTETLIEVAESIKK